VKSFDGLTSSPALTCSNPDIIVMKRVSISDDFIVDFQEKIK
jgi:hypothetical protein